MIQKDVENLDQVFRLDEQVTNTFIVIIFMAQSLPELLVGCVEHILGIRGKSHRKVYYYLQNGIGPQPPHGSENLVCQQVHDLGVVLSPEEYHELGELYQILWIIAALDDYFEVVVDPPEEPLVLPFELARVLEREALFEERVHPLLIEMLPADAFLDKCENLFLSLRLSKIIELLVLFLQFLLIPSHLKSFVSMFCAGFGSRERGTLALLKESHQF